MNEKRRETILRSTRPSNYEFLIKFSCSTAKKKLLEITKQLSVKILDVEAKVISRKFAKVTLLSQGA